MDFKEYQEKAATTCLYKPEVIETCLKLGLMEEAGEVCGVYKKMYRDNNGQWDDARKEKLLKELGDVTWYIAMSFKEMHHAPFIFRNGDVIKKTKEGELKNIEELSKLATANKMDSTSPLSCMLVVVSAIGSRFGWTLSDIFEANIAKLAKRKEENKIHGEGSDR